MVPQAGSKWFDSTRCLFITHARVSVIGQRTRLLPGEMQVRILPWAMGAGRGGNTPPRPSTHDTWIITEKISVATCARMTRIDREDAPFFSSPSAAVVCMRGDLIPAPSSSSLQRERPIIQPSSHPRVERHVRPLTRIAKIDHTALLLAISFGD